LFIDRRTRSIRAMVTRAKTPADRLRLAIDTIPAMVWSLQPDGALDFVNQRWQEYTGLSLEEALKAQNAIVHPEDVGRAVEKWERDKGAGQPFNDELRLRRRDGVYRWFLIRVVPLFNGRGKLVKWYGASTDIEDRKHLENEWQVLIDAIPQQIWSASSTGLTDYCNARWRSYAGLNLDDVQGYGWQTMVHPDDRERVLEAWHTSVAGGTPFEQEERHRGADGAYRWFLCRAVPLRNGEGKILRWYGTNTDIEDRKRAEAALNAQALRYKTLMETSTDSIYILDEEGRLEQANTAFLTGRGYTAAEAKTLNVADWDAQLNLEELRERMRQLVGRSLVFETRHRRKDGSVFDVEVCATGVRIADEQLTLCITRDITERKQSEADLRMSEEKLKTLFKIAPVGISVLDRDRNVIDANPALEKITRLSKEELIKGNWRRRVYLNADGTPRTPEEMTSFRALKENRPLNDVEVGVVTEDGPTIWTQVSAAPLPDGRAVVITQDITERKEAEKKVREANDQLRILSRRLFEAQEHERRHLARELHDEIGQTLTATKLNLKIIAAEVPATVLGRLDDSVKLLDRLLGQVRQLSLDLRPPVLDELGLMPALRWLTDDQAQRAGLQVTFTTNVDALAIPSPVQTACFRVAQEAFTNIIRHAAAKNVAIDLRRKGDRLWLTVRDDGSGFGSTEIPERDSDPSTLGLVSMKERALLVQGGFEVSSQPGRGTEIRAWFPLAFPRKGRESDAS
jgi:PAS domain S-box-containing protein